MYRVGLSLDGKITTGIKHYPDKDGFDICTVDLEDFSVRRTGPSPVSPISTGFLKLRGMLFPVTWTENSMAYGPSVLHIHGLRSPLVGSAVIRGNLDYMRTGSSPGRKYYCVMLFLHAHSPGSLDFIRGLILELVSEGVYRRIGLCFSLEEQSIRLVSKRRRRLFKKPIIFKSKFQSYEEFPFEVHYSPDGCETKISRKASARELRERRGDTEEVVFTII